MKYQCAQKESFTS